MGDYKKTFYCNTWTEMHFSPASAWRSEFEISCIAILLGLLGGVLCLAQGHYNWNNTWEYSDCPCVNYSTVKLKMNNIYIKTLRKDSRQL